MINRFSQFLVEEEKVVYFTFGRMNPPTIGHGKLLDTLAAKAGRNPYKVFLSQSHDPAKNPLSYSDKVKHVRKMFPKHARNVMISKDVKTAIEAVVNLYGQGFRKVVMVVGSDRVMEFDTLLRKYNGKEARHGFYNFQEIKVISAGERDPDAEGVEGASASKQRAAAKENDFIAFSQGVTAAMNTKDARKLFNDVRKGMGLAEETHFKNHIQLAPASAIREKYVKGQLFEIGDAVTLKKTNESGTVVVLGANYLIIELSDGRKIRQWVDMVEKSESMYKDQPDWGTLASTLKAKKITPGEPVKEQSKGLWYNIQQRRKKGLPKLKPGDKNYPKTLDIEKD